MARLAGALDATKTVVGVLYEQDIKYPAAAIAYYAFLSFVPLLLLVVALLGRRFAFEVYTGSARFVTPETQQLLYQALTTASGRTGAMVLSVGAIAWGGANVAVGFLTVVERVEGAVEQPLSTQVRDGGVVLGALSVAILAIFAQSVALSVSSVGLLETLVGFGLLLLVLTGALLPLYYVPSRVVVSPREALPGALTAASGWTVLHAGIQFYTANAAQYAIYGVVSGIVIILTTTYIAAVVLMAGLVVNAVRTTDWERLPPT
ncbi:YhjD/YihY/BrkB family envelope integrity protein [Halobium salinum]|uniref:YhjD/YihY/BrkB family envelope integrity protein n=1 Tax=Halobium salinum TaxID=1364940 RepID=A0ABD5P984_9EURY|nr:YhjD/YihY/BrkB family envelope integrity protein [Halobium salinum]